MKKLISLKSYFSDGDYNDFNNSKLFTIKDKSFYFYFETLVAIEVEGKKYILKNTFGSGAEPYYDSIGEGEILLEEDFEKKVKEIIG